MIFMAKIRKSSFVSAATFLVLSCAVHLNVAMTTVSVPFQPDNFTVLDVDLTSMTLEWYSMSSKSTQFQIWYWPVNASVDLTMTITRKKSHTIKNLESGELYSVWLLAVEGNVTSEYVTLQHRTGSVFHRRLFYAIFLFLPRSA